MNKNFSVFWATQAEADIDAIYSWLFERSPVAAAKVVGEIFDAAESVVFGGQYQGEELVPETRRMVVRNYKIIYTTYGTNLYIIRIFDTRQNPSRL